MNLIAAYSAQPRYPLILSAMQTSSGSGGRTPGGSNYDDGDDDDGGDAPHSPRRRYGEPDHVPGSEPRADRRRTGDKKRAQRVFLRGTHLEPPGTKLQPCLKGTKQSILVDLLRRPEGATMPELLEALSGGNRPWLEVTVRSAFGWDLKNKGYGVRSEFDSYAVERFHLVVPAGKRIPPHSEPRARRSKQALKGN